MEAALSRGFCAPRNGYRGAEEKEREFIRRNTWASYSSAILMRRVRCFDIVETMKQRDNVDG
jgi:hypothetical protein